MADMQTSLHITVTANQGGFLVSLEMEMGMHVGVGVGVCGGAFKVEMRAFEREDGD